MQKHLASADSARATAMEVLGAARRQIDRGYLAELADYEVVPVPAERQRLRPAMDVRLYRLARLVLESRQSILESLTAAYAALGTSGYSVFLYLESDGHVTDVYLGIRGEAERMHGHDAGALLQEVFRGHFPGSGLEAVNGADVDRLLSDIADGTSHQNSSVTAVTAVPALSTSDAEGFAQGLERFLDAADRRRYRALILAEPLHRSRLESIRAGYEQVATQLAPLQSMSWSFGDQDSASVGATLSRSVGETLGHSVGMTETTGTSTTSGTSHSHTAGTNSSTQRPTTGAKVAAVTTGVAGAALALAVPGAGTAAVLLGGAVIQAFSGSISEGSSASDTTGSSTSEGRSESTSISGTSNSSVSTTITDARSDTKTQGTSRQVTMEFNDKSIEQLLTCVDRQLERVDQARTYGGWTASAYFISDSVASSEALSSMYLGLTRGQGSSQEEFALTTWRGAARSRILDWLGQLTHPVLHRPTLLGPDGHVTTPATLLSGREIALQLSLPRHSTSTISVVETRSFGRRVQRVDPRAGGASVGATLQLGRVRHLWENLSQVIRLDRDELSRHAFICGSTGSGKSNVVYSLLKQLHDQGVPFLVIEPAKGEYKHVLGHWPGVRVLGTNPQQAEVLRLNPFSFPDGIHVLEHVDRMIEIFSVCWPMYAAMPAVLKDAILRAYVQCGWDLVASTNEVFPRLFPCFADLLEALEQVINASDYSAEAKSNYLGALGTRVKSLCNGLNGQILGVDALTDAALFDQPVVIDLSRLGSVETRSLIMGMLVMRLGEYRMAVGGMNLPFRHLTVLEEAHNILPGKTSAGVEGAGVAGKSVEMLSNAIAEMRTYGQGFVIADQSPNAVDISAIRNTNIKIVLRLPEDDDRRLIGGAIGLDEGQVAEVARLPRGVAVVHQNDWLEPVLCQFDRFEGEERTYSPSAGKVACLDVRTWRSHAVGLLLRPRLKVAARVNIRFIKDGLDQVMLPSRVRALFMQVMASRLAGTPLQLDTDDRFEELASLVVDVLQCRGDVDSAAPTSAGVAMLRSRLQRLIGASTCELEEGTRNAIEQCMLRDLVRREPSQLGMYAEWNRLATGEL